MKRYLKGFGTLPTASALICQLTLIGLLALTGCNGSSDATSSADDSSESASEIATSTASGALAASEGTSAAQNIPSEPVVQASAKENADEHAFRACPTLANSLGSCSNGTVTLSYDNCRFKEKDGFFFMGRWNGTQEIRFSNGSALCPDTMAAIETRNLTLYRTTGSEGLVRRSPNGTVITLSTQEPSGYDTSIFPQPAGGTEVRFTDGNGSRRIAIHGIHLTATRESKNGVYWDHTVSTANDSPLEVSVEDGKKKLNGTIIVQHNRAQYTARAEFKDVKYDHEQCGCHPISGQVTTTFSGSRNGSETLNFEGCGVARFKTAAGVATGLALNHCL